MIDYTPQQGDIFLTQIGGATGAVIRVGQALLGGDFSEYTHAGIFLGHGLLLAAQPAGARVDPIDTVMDDRPLAILKVPDWAQDRRAEIARTAIEYVGHRYGFLSYPWIGLSRLIPDNVLNGPGFARFRDKVASEDAMICSALVDRVWARCGIHLFTDGRLLGTVTPGALSTRGTVHHVGTGPWPTADVAA